MKLDKFDLEHFCMYVEIDKEEEQISLCFFDELSVIDELPNLPIEYETKIIHFLNNSNNWYPKSAKEIINEFGNKVDYKLTSIYILSEPSDALLSFGLGFWCSEDREHGRGVKIQDETFEILEYGTLDIISYPYGLY